MAPKVVAPCDLNLYILLVFMDHVQIKNDDYQPQDEFFLDIYIYIQMYTYQAQQQNTFHKKTLKPKCDDKNYKKIQNFKLESEIDSKLSEKTFLILSI
jgi:hypothetical protein